MVGVCQMVYGLPCVPMYNKGKNKKKTKKDMVQKSEGQVTQKSQSNIYEEIGFRNWDQHEDSTQ